MTLINEVQRVKYDNELNPRGDTGAAEKRATFKKAPVKIFEINRQGFSSVTRKNQNSELKIKISQNQRIGEILARPEISGADLKEIRNELGVAIEKIHQETKIRLDYLNYIEENEREKLPAAVFIKGFVKAYLKSLCIEPVEEITARYMNSLDHKN